MNEKKAKNMKNYLAELRTDALMTQDELAQETGISKTTISLIENQHQIPRPITKKKLANSLGCKVVDIFPESE